MPTTYKASPEAIAAISMAVASMQGVAMNHGYTAQVALAKNDPALQPK